MRPYYPFKINSLTQQHFFYSESGKKSHFEGSKQEGIDALRLRDNLILIVIH